MAEKSEGAEALLKKVADLLATKLAERAARVADMAGDDPDLVRQIDALARAGRNIAAMQVAAGKAIKAMAALDDTAPDKDTPMNDDAASDRLEQLHAELDRRLAAFARSLELKGLEGGGDRGSDGGPAGRLGAVEPPASKAA